MADKKKKEDVLNTDLEQKTTTVNAPTYTIEEAAQIVNAMNFEKVINIVKQILVIFGIVVVVLMYIVTMDALFELSLFGCLFNHTSYVDAWNAMTTPLIDESGNVVRSAFFDDWAMQGRWIPVISITLYMIIFTVAAIFGVAITFRDIFNTIRRLIKGSKKTITTVATMAKDAATIDEDGKPIEKKISRKEKKAKEKAEKAAKADAEYREIMGIGSSESVDANLDKMLGGETVAVTADTKDRDSLFDDETETK